MRGEMRKEEGGREGGGRRKEKGREGGCVRAGWMGERERERERRHAHHTYDASSIEQAQHTVIAHGHSTAKAQQRHSTDTTQYVRCQLPRLPDRPASDKLLHVLLPERLVRIAPLKNTKKTRKVCKWAEDVQWFGVPLRTSQYSLAPFAALSPLLVYAPVSVLLGATQAPIRRVNIYSGSVGGKGWHEGCGRGRRGPTGEYSGHCAMSRRRQQRGAQRVRARGGRGDGVCV